MKRFLSITALLLCLMLTVCSCGNSLDSIKNNLIKKDYTVTEIKSEQIDSLNEDMYIGYNAKGKIISGFRAKKESTGEYLQILVFENKSELELMYKNLRSSLSADESIDFSGNILLYGSKNALKIALK